MRHLAFALAGFAALAACEPPAHGGTGSTQSGEPLTGEINISEATSLNEVIIRGENWSCTGKYDRYMGTDTARNFPLDCTDETSGAATITAYPDSFRSIVAFRLANGTAGRVGFNGIN
ncbi:hypothetical protein [Tropicimonas sp.]|uniref:hypothetical protein n=1 Tax=Tropicimonas sp. TaxID=2067044 RepID=UPI003A8B0C6A